MKRTYSLSTSTMTGTAMHRSTYLAAIWLTILLTCLCSTAVQAQTVTVQYIHTDALGSPVAVTNEAGQVIERTNWEPYGAAIGKPNYDGPGYTGHVMDGATGLTYMQQRYYDKDIGRFLSVDPVTAYGGDMRHFNRYAYGYNNPYKFSDPNGCLPIFIPVFAGVMLMVHSEYANAPAPGEATRTVTPAEAAGTFTSALPPGRMAAGMKMAADIGKQAGQSSTRKHTGSYTNTHESGKTYDGKGSKARSQESGRRIERETGDKHVATDWTSAKNNREAFKQESSRLDSNGGPRSENNHNKIESPGRKMREEDMKR